MRIAYPFTPARQYVVPFQNRCTDINRFSCHLNLSFIRNANIFSTTFRCRSQWPHGLGRRSVAVRLLSLWFEMHRRHGRLSVVSVVK